MGCRHVVAATLLDARRYQGDRRLGIASRMRLASRSKLAPEAMRLSLGEDVAQLAASG
jgi:hypothetical protein